MNKTNQILTVYLKKTRVYLNLTKIHEFGGQEVLEVKLEIKIYLQI